VLKKTKIFFWHLKHKKCSTEQVQILKKERTKNSKKTTPRPGFVLKKTKIFFWHLKHKKCSTEQVQILKKERTKNSKKTTPRPGFEPGIAEATRFPVLPSTGLSHLGIKTRD
jgi:hypothetical protein